MNIENKIEKYLNESKGFTIEFNTRPFENSHGKKPGGRGSWAFALDGELSDPEAKKLVHKGGKKWIYLSPSMTYVEAKKWITALIRKESDIPAGHNVIVNVEG